MRGLENKVAVVTGGSSGIGKGIVEALLDHKVNVVVMSRKSDGIKDLLEKYDGQLVFSPGDVTKDFEF